MSMARLGTALLFYATYAAAQTAGPNLNLTKARGNQYETAVAISPKDGKQIFVVSRNETGGLYTARSYDGGSTWTSRLMAQSTVPAVGDVPRAYGNPSAAWDDFGNLFLAYLYQSSVRGPTYVCLAVSADGGATFYSPNGQGAVLTLPISAPGTPVIGDQPTVTVGPGSAGFAGSVWVTYWIPSGIAVSGAGVSGPGDVGQFTTLQPEQPPGVNFGDIAVGPQGEVIVAYGPNSGSSGTVYANVKPDGLGPGAFSTYTAAVAVNIGGFTPLPAQPNWGIDPEAGLAWDRGIGPHHGRMYLVYTDAPAPGSPDTDVFVVHSDDSGATWSSPVRVNDDPGTNSQFLPHMSLDRSTGSLAVTWYDARNSANNDTVQYFGAFSNDGGESFTPNFQISKGTSNQANSIAALKKADYGDYTGGAFANGVLVPAWADNSNSTGDNPDGATEFDVYTAVIQEDAIGGRPKIFKGGVINASAFGGQAGVAPGTWIEIYGSHLAGEVRDWTAQDFNGGKGPSELGGVQVSVNGKPGIVSHIGPGQINAQVPDEIGAGAVPVVVINHGQASDAVMVEATPMLPGLLAPASFNNGGRQYVFALAQNGGYAGVPDGFEGGRPAHPGEIVTLYGIGFGPVTPAARAGEITTDPRRLQNPLTVLFDGTAADLQAAGTYTGLAPNAVGLYQFNIQVPNVSDGEHQLEMTIGGVVLAQKLYITTRYP